MPYILQHIGWPWLLKRCVSTVREFLDVIQILIPNLFLNYIKKL
jgi:hypothetical protein